MGKYLKGEGVEEQKVLIVSYIEKFTPLHYLINDCVDALLKEEFKGSKMKEVKQKFLKDQTQWSYTAVDRDGRRWYYTHPPINKDSWWDTVKHGSAVQVPKSKAACCYISGKKDWTKSLRKLKKVEPTELVFMDFLEEFDVKEEFLENCKTLNQRWLYKSSYYDSLHVLKDKPNAFWISAAFNYSNVDREENWISINTEWKALIYNTTLPVVWDKT